MDVHIDTMTTRVNVVDDRSLLSPDVMETIVRAVLAHAEKLRAAAEKARDDTDMWTSVRSER